MEKAFEIIGFVLLPLQQYAPSVFEKYTTSVTLGKKEIALNLYDTAGKEFHFPDHSRAARGSSCAATAVAPLRDIGLGVSPNPAQPFVTSGK